MKTTKPGFWKYFWAYLLICSGTALIALNIIGRVFLGEKESLAGGLIAIWMGIFFLIVINKARGNKAI